MTSSINSTQGADTPGCHYFALRLLEGPHVKQFTRVFAHAQQGKARASDLKYVFVTKDKPALNLLVFCRHHDQGQVHSRQDVISLFRTWQGCWTPGRSSLLYEGGSKQLEV